MQMLGRQPDNSTSIAHELNTSNAQLNIPLDGLRQNMQQFADKCMEQFAILK
jgi:hypothetical protein